MEEDVNIPEMAPVTEIKLAKSQDYEEEKVVGALPLPSIRLTTKNSMNFSGGYFGQQQGPNQFHIVLSMNSINLYLLKTVPDSYHRDWMFTDDASQKLTSFNKRIPSSFFQIALR